VRGANSYEFNSTTTPARALQVPAVFQVADGDFLALSVASLYRSELWSVTERLEHRNGSVEDRWSFTSGYREAVKAKPPSHAASR
jgi:hypothetical protein